MDDINTKPVEDNINQNNDNNTEIKKKEFFKIIKDFIVDLLNTFPEFKDNLHLGFIDILEDNFDTKNAYDIYVHCKNIYPTRFFDILYQNEELFSDLDKDTNEENENGTNRKDKGMYLLPNIDFVYIWKEDISDHTKGIIWKYLQLILFTLISDVKDGSEFGDTAKLFQAINEDEFKNKLEETLESMTTFFESNNVDTMHEKNENENTKEYKNDASCINLESLPNPEEIHNHINGMLNGKLGSLAREIAEETAEELNIDMEGASSVQDVFKQLFKNPGKLMSIVKNVGNKLETKLKSGEISESDLIKETTEMMSNMKNIPGMGNINKIMREMGVNMPFGGGRNTKVNMGAFQSHMNTNMKNAQMRERMRQKLEKKQQSQQSQQTDQLNENINGDCFGIENQTRNVNMVYSKGEKVEKTKRVKTNNNENTTSSNDKKKKKRKNKK